MSRPYQRPTLAEQFGLKPDPNKLEHEFHGGVRLTKMMTAGGHPVETDQPGFPVYHRRIANPYPVMALGIGSSLLALGCINLGARGLTQMNITMNFAIPLGGISTVAAGMFAFADGNTFMATFGCTLGGLLASFGAIFLPWTGIQQAYIVPAITAAGGNQQVGFAMGALALQKAVGIVFFAAMVPVFLIFLASLRTAFPVAFGSFLIVIATILSGVEGLKYPNENLAKASGALYVIIGGMLMYSAMAVLMQEEGVPVPVFALPRNDD